MMLEDYATTSNSKAVEVPYPPCRKACPAGINVQAYVALIAQDKFQEALEVIRDSIPFPSVCGRVCFAPCEDACARGDIDEPLAIRALKRLVADHEFDSEMREQTKTVPKTREEKIAIIGAGPAGLTAGYELARMGYPVTVFESDSKPGGALRYCIPEYRLPEVVLDAEIDDIIRVGVELRTDVEIGEGVAFDELRKEGYQAVFVATGAHRCVRLGIVGEELSGVFHALDFLKSVRCEDSADLGSRVVIIGGGNVAIDAARTARRLIPGEVTIVYRRSAEEMPAHREEVEAAKREGVKIRLLTSPKRIIGENGKVVGMEFVKNELGAPDASGRRRPVPVAESEFTIPVDSVLLAIGERPDVSFLPKDVEVTRGNLIVVDEVTLETTLPGVFAGGDAVTGPASVIEAIAAGKKAAVSIDRYIRGLDVKAGRTQRVPEMTWLSHETTLKNKPRQVMSSLEPAERVTCFREVELGLTPEAGLLEAHRCLFCGPCSECLEMKELCVADEVEIDEDRCIACANCEKVCEYGAIKVEKSVARVNPLLCKGCGTCVVECPAQAITMLNFNDAKIVAQIEGAATSWTTEKEPQVLAFVCNWSWDEDTDRFEWPQNIHVVPVRCSGRVDPLHVLRAFMLGADGVLVISCEQKDCHYTFGSSLAEKRVGQMKEWLQAIDVNPDRLQMAWSAIGKEQHLREAFEDFSRKLEGLGWTPFKEKS